MCDEARLKEWAAGVVSRRQFGALAGTAAIVACAPGDAVTAQDGSARSSLDLMESAVTFVTDDGTMDAFFVHPAAGAHPGVIFWPDIASIRESKRKMARRLAGEGYSVLVLNPYYRDVAGEQFEDFAAFRAGGGFGKVGPWRAKLTAEPIMRDARAIVGWLDRQASVDTARGVGTRRRPGS